MRRVDDWFRFTRYVMSADNHDTNSVILDTYYGFPLMYHAGVSGPTWPGDLDLIAGQFTGQPVLTAPERFAATYAPSGPHYFIVTDMGLYRGQPDLQKFLEDHYTKLVEDYNFMIVDLRARRKP